MSFSPQILQQVQDSIVPRPILVVPIKPLVVDTNTAEEKTDIKESKSTKYTSQKTNAEKAVSKNITLTEVKKDNLASAPIIESTASLSLQDTTISVTSDSLNLAVETKIEDTIVPLNYRTSLFTNHELKSDYFEAKERNQRNNDWILAIILLISLLLLVNKVLTPKKWSQQFKIIFSKRAFDQQLRDEKDFRSPFLLMQYITSLLTITLFINQLFYYKAIIPIGNEMNYSVFIKILTSIVGLFFIYFISLKILGFIVEKRKLVSDYLLSTLLLFNNTGTFLLPLTISMEYAHDILINVGLFLLSFSFLFKLYKGLTIASSYNSLHLFYLFLYICTLEILPIAIAIKFMSENL